MVELAYYIANKGRCADKIQALLIGSEYSHVELNVDGISYSSSFRDQGVRKKEIIYGDKWEVHRLSNNIDIQRFKNFYKIVACYPYDLLGGIMNQVVQYKKEINPKRYYCSEFVIDAINALCHTKINKYIHINQLYLKSKRGSLQ